MGDGSSVFWPRRLWFHDVVEIADSSVRKGSVMSVDQPSLSAQVEHLQGVVDRLLRGRDAEVEELRARVASLEAQVRPLQPDVAVTGDEVESAEAESSELGTWTRRGLLIGGIGAAVGAASVVSALPAAATTGNFVFGNANDAGSSSTTLNSTTGTNTLIVNNTNNGGAIRGSSNVGVGVTGQGNSSYGVYATSALNHALRAQAFGSANSGVYADNATGTGVLGKSTSGTGVVAQSDSGPSIQLISARNAVPSNGTWLKGSLVATTNGELWLCVADGTPGSWRLLGSSASAGAFIPVTPTRVYDSRKAQPDANTILTAGSSRVVSVKDGRDASTGAVTVANLVPAGTKAVSLNLTVTATTAAGYVTLTPGIAVSFSGSAINWTAPNQTIANGLIVPVDATRSIKAWCNFGNAHVVLDVNGYFRAA